MWVCSNCGNRQEGEPTCCKHCGFDESAYASRYPTLIPKRAKQSSAYKPSEPEERPHRKRARSKYKRYFKAKDARKLCVDGRLPKAVILPDGIDVVVRDAFWGIPGTTADKIILPRGLKKVQEEAFGHLTVQDYIVIPDSVTEIGKNAFRLGEKAHVQCNQGSYAYRYCVQNHLRNSVDLEYKRKKQEEALWKKRRDAGLCPYCGGSYTFFFPRCRQCGRKRRDTLAAIKH